MKKKDLIGNVALIHLERATEILCSRICEKSLSNQMISSIRRCQKRLNRCLPQTGKSRR